jgi:hypothetical protein
VSEEVAGYENRLTRLTTLVQVAIGILVVLLGRPRYGPDTAR